VNEESREKSREEAVRKYQLSARGRIDRGSVGWVLALLGGAKSYRGDTDEGGGSRVGLAEVGSLSEG